MRILRAALLIAAGLVVGVLLSSRASAAADTQVASDTRISVTKTSKLYAFLFDEKSDGCWLATLNAGGQVIGALAPAPLKACTIK